jgi:hypothetical protein
MYSVAWAYTSPAALEQRTAEARRAPGAALAAEHAESADARSAAMASTAAEPAARHAAEPAAVARSDVRQERRRPAGGHRAERGVHSWRAVAGAGMVAVLGAVVMRGFRGGAS